MERASWSLVEHTADIGVCVSARSLEELFATAAGALAALLIEPLAPFGNRMLREHPISLHAADTPELLVRWLSDLLYLHDTGGLIFRELKVSAFSSDHLAGVVFMEPFDPACHRILREVKAVTYHQLAVEQVPGGWRAQIIFDV